MKSFLSEVFCVKDKPTGFKNLVSNTGKATSELFRKTKKAVVSSLDQNDDGKLNLTDISAISERRAESKEQKRLEAERKALSPIFEEDIEKPDFVLPKLIRVAEIDKKHAESEICRGSIGYETIQKDLRIVSIYPDKTELFGLKFYPDIDCEVYYVDPCDRDFYIAMDDYFNYLKVARVGELQKIAQDLGAKHFRVTYKEQEKSITGRTANTKIGGAAKADKKTGAGIEHSHESSSSSFSSVEIAAEMECIGHKPVEPTLVYFRKDLQIQNLVSLRMADNAMTHQVYTLQLSKSSGIKVKDAMNIDAALSAMKLSGNVTVTSEAQSETRRYFEYEIDF